MYSKLTFFISCCLIFSSCFSNTDKVIDIRFSPNKSAIVIKNLTEVEIYQLKNNLNANAGGVVNVWQLQQGKETEVKGALHLTADSLTFKPEKDFVLGQPYLVRTILGVGFGSFKDMAKGDVGKSVKWKEQTLDR